jgi:hypothetical protein
MEHPLSESRCPLRPVNFRFYVPLQAQLVGCVTDAALVVFAAAMMPTRTA